MTRYAPQWLQSGSYAASLDRRLIGALWPSPASSGVAVTAAGTGMDLHIDPGQVAVATANSTGSVLCTSDAIETVTLAPAPPAGTDRVDLIVCQPRSIDLDGTSTQEDFIFAVIAGLEGAPPGAAPAVPAGTVALAQVHVAGGSASLVAGNITDRRPGPLAVPNLAAYKPTVKRIAWQKVLTPAANAYVSYGVGPANAFFTYTDPGPGNPNTRLNVSQDCFLDVDISARYATQPTTGGGFCNLYANPGNPAPAMGGDRVGDAVGGGIYLPTAHLAGAFHAGDTLVLQFRAASPVGSTTLNANVYAWPVTIT